MLMKDYIGRSKYLTDSEVEKHSETHQQKKIWFKAPDRPPRATPQLMRSPYSTLTVLKDNNMMMNDF